MVTRVLKSVCLQVAEKTRTIGDNIVKVADGQSELGLMQLQSIYVDGTPLYEYLNVQPSKDPERATAVMLFAKLRHLNCIPFDMHRD